MKETVKLILTLTLICLVAGGLLAAADALTRDRIAMVKQQRRQQALNAVLPAHDNNPLENAVTVEHDERKWTFYKATKASDFAGAAVETQSPNGYGGDIKLMFGIDANGKSIGIAILEQMETPGLGANIETDDFKKRLAGRDVKQTDWRVKKDGGDIDHITAATISSRAVTDAVRDAVDAYLANQQTIENGGN